MSPEPLLELRQALHAALGFRSDIPTATFEQIIAVAKATAKRADDAEQALAEVHEALDEAGVKLVSGSVELDAADRVRVLIAERNERRAEVVNAHAALDAMPCTTAPDCPTPAGRVKYATAAWLDERKEASNLATLCQAAHDALTAAGVANEGTPAERIRLLVDEREEARDTIDGVHHALDDAKVRSVSDSGGLLATDRIRLLAADRAAYRAELDAYRSRGVPPTVAEPATGGLALSAREVRALLAITDCPAPHNVRSAVRALLGVPDGR